MGHSVRKGPTLLEKEILSYAYHVEKSKIPFQTSTPAA